MALMLAIKSDHFASVLVNPCITTRFSPAAQEHDKPTIRLWGAEVCLKVNVELVEAFGRSCALCPAGADVGR